MAIFDPGYVLEPFRTLAENYPGDTVYPWNDFRVEWGPIFHRGRLDGTARVLAIGQDPAQHENVLRRILVGEAGRRVQGFLKKLGITKSYVILNALLYSVYGKNKGAYVSHPDVTAYRNDWIQGILASGNVEAVVAFGSMAKDAWHSYVSVHGAPAGVAVEHVKHPTFPESAGKTEADKDAKTAEMLGGWNDALQALHPAITNKDVPTPLVLYGAAFLPGDKADIPSMDLPAGTPSWMYDDDGWAARKGSSAAAKRRNITITVPAGVIP